MNLTEAIEKHAMWKTRFRAAISKQESLDASAISKDNCCDLGRWLYGDGKNHYGALPAFNDCMRNHAVFHAEAGNVAQAINQKRYAEAEQMLSNGTSYSNASSAVCNAITRLKRDVRI